MLRDIWADEDINEQTKTTYQYVLELRERLESTCKLAHDELRKAQGNQHKWFNKKAKAKHLKAGDQVLLLLLTKLNKLKMHTMSFGKHKETNTSGLTRKPKQNT